jgi:peptidoglycan hydrolase-like protein with peptidoglycan-binding domain
LPPTTTTLPPNVEVVGPSPVPIEAVGARDGAATAVVQDRLTQLGFWNSASDGKYGLTTKQAVMAFQKYLGLDPSGKVDDVTAQFLTNFPEKAHGASDTGDLVEIDKTKQLLFIIRGGKTLLVLNTSTGNDQPYEEEDQNSPGEMVTGVALTPEGLWDVYRERPEGWWEGDLGQIYRPKYFRGGVAVHGSNSIPNHPASHGCVRVSVPAMDMIWAFDLMPKHSVVWVHS